MARPDGAAGKRQTLGNNQYFNSANTSSRPAATAPQEGLGPRQVRLAQAPVDLTIQLQEALAYCIKAGQPEQMLKGLRNHRIT